MDPSIRRPYVCTLSPKTLEKAKRELNEDPDTRDAKIDELRAKFKKERPEIKLPPEDAFFVRYLRNKKYDVDRAFKMIVNYYEVRRKYPELYNNCRPSAYKQLYELGIQGILPKRDNQGRLVSIGKMSLWDPDRFDYDFLMAGYLLSMEKMIQDEETQVNGIVVVGDYEGLKMKHVLKLGPTQAKKQMDCIMNAIPIRFKAAHYIRQPDIFETMFSIFRPFMSAKLIKRLHFHGQEYGTLHDYVPSSILPPEFGGQFMDFNCNEWYENLMKCDAEFEYMDQFGIPKASDVLGGTAQGVDASGGIAGSFKKLSVD
ncbi:alpha-tocopherol transfer protein-like [Saccoglossus kowalevskii]|uniref:Alpha-tocopherol transfer protein-like n=1 Tax=Saccoglossus kowalevskii TaxID=10224 RepID=A0ABM0GI76_SACKO|nr:PREDICTED: alpha-tocopherol transfer protein-like [Saccoglossus kowalevskii]